MRNNQVFPGLSHALDSKKVGNIIENAERQVDPEIFVENCLIADVRMEADNECIILYRIKFSHRNLKTSKEQLYLGKVLKIDAMPSSFPKETIIEKTLGIIFIPFPYDPSIPWLPKTCNTHEMITKMPLVFFDKGIEIKNIIITNLAYVPQMRATFLYTMDVLDKKSGEIKRIEWIAKTNVSKPPQRVYSNYLALWQSSEGKIPVPRPMGFLLDPQLTFQEKIPGIRLGALVNVPHIHQLIKDTAIAIAQLHNLKTPLTHTRNLQQEIKNLNRWSGLLATLSPNLKKRMEKLKGQIIAKMSENFRVESPIHADFHHTNILIDGQNVHMIDMDEVAYGDPCIDIGRFLSSLRIPSLRVFGNFDGLKTERELFIDTYLKHAPKDEKKIHLFESASLFTSAASTFRMQRRNWEQEIPLLLEESEKAFEKSKQKRSLQAPPPMNHCIKLSKIECLKWAKNEEYIKTLLAPHFHMKTGQEIVKCQYLSESTQKGYQTLSYTVTTLFGIDQHETKIIVFIHNKRKGRHAYRYMKFLNESMKGIAHGLKFQEPIAYLPEIEALAFYENPGISLKKLIQTSQAALFIDLLEKGLTSLHHLKLLSEDNNKDGSYILKSLSLSNIKFFEGFLYVDFPIRKYIGDPAIDLELLNNLPLSQQ